ncbi:hypothetical protein PsorP6_012416 [Peronosclerospora sorghi]|uniref:Uncharacterized protein n=1 Tax=Peronosclerospora sorghi TaxID=230839 RepID=A0ACC0WGL3_9STRA|nr:hypothetical protein PsorP6_012416 [Peronosclerospora sorghi]
MTDSMYTTQPQAYVKLMLHAAKWPANSVYGLLLGQKEGNGFVIKDAVPLFHHESPLAPLFEVACAMVDAYCQKGQEVTIIGFYYGENGYTPSDASHGLSHFAEKVADRVEQNCTHACVLVVDKEQLSNEMRTGLHLLLKDVKRSWSRMDPRLHVANGAAKVLTQGLRQNAHEDVIDFEEHVAKPSRDWRNLQVVELLKLNV